MWENIQAYLAITNPVYYALPIFAILTGLELYVNYRERRGAYEFKDVLGSYGMGIGSLFIDVVSKSTALAVFFLVYQYRLVDDWLTFHWWAWVLLLFADDLSFYVHHRTSHTVRLLWAAHVNHHSSQHFHLITAIRQSWTEVLYKYSFYVWLAFLGFHPVMIIMQISISLIYQFWTHTQFIGKLPPLIEFIFNTPSHHRVHHGSNIKYLDKNHGGIFIIWDRLFGTFQEELEEEPVVYGLVTNINTFNPIKIATHEFASIAQDVWHAPGLMNKLKYIFYPPGWSHDGSRMTSKELVANEQRKRLSKE